MTCMFVKVVLRRCCGSCGQRDARAIDGSRTGCGGIVSPATDFLRTEAVPVVHA